MPRTPVAPARPDIVPEPTLVSEADSARGTRPLVAAGPFSLPPLVLLDWLVLLVAALMPVAYVPQMAASSTSPKLALLLGALPVGAWCLVGLSRRRDLPALFGASFVAAAALSALVNDAPIQSLKGHIRSHSSVLIYAGVIALWALGRSASPACRRLVGPVIVASTALNILVGVVQIVFEVYGGPLGTIPGRASGLMENAAFFSSGIAGPAMFALVRSAQTRRWGWLSMLTLYAFGAGISGARGAVAIVALAAVIAAVATRGRGWVVVPAVMVGNGLAAVFTSHFGGITTASRFASKGADGRLQIWWYDLLAWTERPILGWGFGNHGAAVRPHFTAEFTRTSAYDDMLISWTDPHNVVMMMLVCTGSVGVLLIGSFVVTQLRFDRDLAYLMGFLGAAANWLLQPATLHSLPIAMLLLGLAAPRVHSPIGRRSSHVGQALGIAVALGVAVPVLLMTHSVRSGDLDGANRYASVLGPDIVITNDLADKFTNRATTRPGNEAFRDEALDWSRRPLDVDDGQPFYWVLHAKRLMTLGEYGGVQPALDRAFALERWNPSAWATQLSYAAAIEDYELADRARAVVCDLDLYLCVAESDPYGESAQD